MLRLVICAFLGMLLACQKGESPTVGTAQSIYLQTFGGERNEQALDVHFTSEGNYWVLAETQSTQIPGLARQGNDYDFWLLKFSADHNLQDQFAFGAQGDDRPTQMILLSDEHWLMVGGTTSTLGNTPTAGLQDFWLQKFSREGAIIWERSYGFAGVETAYDVVELSDGDLVVSGILDVSASGGLGDYSAKTYAKHAGGDYWVMRLSPEGDLRWSRYFGGTNTDTAYALEVADNGNLYVLGTSDSDDFDVAQNRGSYDAWLLVLSPAGELIQQANFGGSQIENFHAIAPGSNGSFYLVGDSRSSDGDLIRNLGGADIWVVKIDAEAQVIWEKSYGGSDFDSAFQAIATPLGGLVVVGSSRSSTGDFTENKGYNDALAFAIDAQGNLLWQKSWGGSDFDRAYGIAAHPEQGYLVVGTTASSDGDISTHMGFNDIFVTHLIP